MINEILENFIKDGKIMYLLILSTSAIVKIKISLNKLINFNPLKNWDESNLSNFNHPDLRAEHAADYGLEKSMKKTLS
jgi:hypothetical protein